MPESKEFSSKLIAPATIDNRRAEGSAADGVGKSNRGAADRNRTNSQPAHGHADPHSGTAESEQQSERQPTHAEHATGETRDRDTANRDVSNRDEAFGNSGPHSCRIDTGANVNKRPAGDCRLRPILESNITGC